MSKMLQIVGAIAGFAGLIGDETLIQWERSLRAAIGRGVSFSWIRRILVQMREWFLAVRATTLSNENCLHSFVTVVSIIVWVILALVSAFSRDQARSSVYEYQRENPYGYAQLVCIAVVFWGFVILALQFLPSEEFNRLWDRSVGFLNRLYTAYQNIVFGLTFGVVALAFIPLIGLVLLGCLLIAVAAIGVLILIFFVIRIALLPYQILDLIAARLRLKSTVLLIGLVCELIGIVLS